MTRIYSLLIIVALVTAGCEKEEINPSFGPVQFSFTKVNHNLTGGRIQDASTPAYISYTIKKSDGSILSNKIELYSFNDDFVTQPQQLNTGHYTLEQFIILDSNNKTIYASPLAGSELAYLVEHPLPLSFEIVMDETTTVVPEVIKVEEAFEPVEFGYTAFGFEVAAVMDFDVRVTIADYNQHNAIDYTLEVIAKDAPLGNVKWTKTISMSGNGNIKVPAKYGHYTFKATKAGYIPHVQHFLGSELFESTYDLMSFEFIPESLDGFIKHEAYDGIIKVYFPNDHYRSKLYARIDVSEGYSLELVGFDKNAASRTGYSISDFCYFEFYPPWPTYISVFGRNVNLFNNTPFSIAQNLEAHLWMTNLTQTLNDVNFSSYIYMEVHPTTESLPDIGYVDFYQLWKGANNP